MVEKPMLKLHLDVSFICSLIVGLQLTLYSKTAEQPEPIDPAAISVMYPVAQKVGLTDLLYSSDLVLIGYLENPAETQGIFRINQVRVERVYASTWTPSEMNEHLDLFHEKTNIYVVSRLPVGYLDKPSDVTLIFGEGRYLLFLRFMTNIPPPLLNKTTIDPLWEIARTNPAALPKRFAPSNMPPLFTLSTKATFELSHKKAGAWCLNREQLKNGRYKSDLYAGQDKYMNVCFQTNSLSMLTNGVFDMLKAISSPNPDGALERLKKHGNVIVQNAAKVWPLPLKTNYFKYSPGAP